MGKRRMYDRGSRLPPQPRPAGRHLLSTASDPSRKRSACFRNCDGADFFEAADPVAYRRESEDGQNDPEPLVQSGNRLKLPVEWDSDASDRET